MNSEPLINLLMVYYKELRSCQKDLLRGEIGLGIFCIKFLVAKSQLIKFFCVFPLFFLFMLDPKLRPNGPFPVETERKKPQPKSLLSTFSNIFLVPSLLL